MASLTSSWAAPSLARYRPAVLALTALAAGCTIYYIHEQIWSSLRPPKASLQRSNAQRQRRRTRRRLSASASRYLAPGPTARPRYVPDVPWGTVPVSLDFLEDEAANQEIFGDHLFLSSTVSMPSITTPLSRRMPSERNSRGGVAHDEEASIYRREVEEAFLCFYFWKHIAPSPITDEQRDFIISHLGEESPFSGAFSADIITTVLQWHQSGILTERIEWWELLIDERLIDDRRGRVDEGQIYQPNPINGALASTMHALEGRETVADVDSEHSWREDDATNDGQDGSDEGQNLGNLLWRIAEEQARKESYIHRGVTCNSCSAMPIKGIRYRCSNCVDFDLCEQCEALQIHPKTHLFYKVRIPAPFLGNSRQPQPVWYPGRPTTARYNVPKEIMEKIKGETGYQAVEVEALWEQFRCLAATEWDDDPCEYNLAIDRRTFDKCFVPNTSTRPPAPNLIYDRAFSFYDVDNDGLIGFEEFINGRAVLSRDKPYERWKRVFKGYDINNDGFVDRRDFLRLFRAYYALTKEITLDVISGIEDDVSENGARDIILGSQPISSAFSGAIPLGERSRTDEGKRLHQHGDYVIYDEIGLAIDDRDREVVNFDEVLADSTEAARFGHVQRKGLIGPWVGDVIKNDKWPPSAINLSDLHKVFPHLNELKDVTAVQDQEAVRRVAHERVAREHQQRQFIRRIAVRNRKQRQSFYLDRGDTDKEEKHSESEDEGIAGSLRKTDKSRKDNLILILESSKAGEFRTRLIDCIKAMDWPLETPEKLMNDVFEMIQNEWGGKEIAEDLCGYGSLQHDAIDFVATFDSLISHISGAIIVPGHQESADEQRKSLPSSSSRRSRSSSKVRFRDDVGTDDEHDSRSRATSISSRSIPVNERWGGFAPEPEKDVGREVLYQVTQEALNELLDPVFRVREDLALAAVRTRRMRELHRAEIIASVKNPFMIKSDLDTYQKRWRLKKQGLRLGCLDGREIEETFGADELLTFISKKEAGERDKGTGELCSRCKSSGVESWIWAGGFCTSCGKPSAEAIEPTATDPKSPPVVCSNCVKTVVTPGGCCGDCGALSKEAIDEEEKLWKILGRGQENLKQEVIQDEAELKSTPNEEAEPLFPPEALENLHSSVDAFNEANPPALEETIAQKPLEELLAESGYAPTSPSNTSRSLSPPPDPTLPQNRPNEVLESDPNLQLDGISDVATSVSVSSQHNLHTIQTRIPTVYLREPPNPTPDPTLPQNRPNNLTPPSMQTTSPTPTPNSTPNSTSTSTPELTPKVTVKGVPHNNNPGQNQDSDEADDAAVADPNLLMYYAMLDILEAEDGERGGPGRLNFAEWEDIMRGENGQALGFLGSWIEIASF